MNKQWIFSLFILCASTVVSATELQPWFGRDKQLECRLSNLYRYYPSVNTGHGTKHYSSHDDFFDAGIAVSPTPDWSAEFELLAADTHRRSCGLDSLLFTVRYLICSDIAAEAPVSAAVGITLDHASHVALKDISSFHHARTDYELHLAVGKEWECDGFWTSHLWGLIGYGLAHDERSWLHFIGAYDYNFWDWHQIGIRAEGLYGFGTRDLHIHRFNGYGPIEHRSADLGVHYTYQWAGMGTIDLGYAYRVWARNFPARAQTLVFTLTLPFGL